ncbi:DNA polymerase III subunit delta [Patescibacteria group bacterium]
MRFLVYGQDVFRSRQKLAALRERFSATRDASGLNERTLRSGEHGSEEVAEALFASPFLAERKLVLLVGYLRGDKDVQDAVADLLGRVPESTVAVFYEEAGAAELKRSPLFAPLEKEKFTEEFPELDGRQAVGFLAQDVAEFGVQIEVRACQALVELVGTDSWALHNAAQRLAAYAASRGEKMVTEAMVRETVDGQGEEPIFAFLDACVQGRAREAVRLLERLLDSGAAELQIMTMLQKQMRTLLGAKDLLERGVADKREVAERLGVHPFPAGKAMAAARNVALDDLRQRFDALVELERKFKVGQADLRTELGLFANRISKQGLR